MVDGHRVVHGQGPANHAILYEPLGLTHLRIETMRETDHQTYAGPLTGNQHPIRLINTETNRLLHHHVRAGLGGRLGRGQVQSGW
jgi:hypothetical protein